MPTPTGCASTLDVGGSAVAFNRSTGNGANNIRLTDELTLHDSATRFVFCDAVETTDTGSGPRLWAPVRVNFDLTRQGGLMRGLTSGYTESMNMRHFPAIGEAGGGSLAMDELFVLEDTGITITDDAMNDFDLHRIAQMTRTGDHNWWYGVLSETGSDPGVGNWDADTYIPLTDGEEMQIDDVAPSCRIGQFQDVASGVTTTVAVLNLLGGGTITARLRVNITVNPVSVPMVLGNPFSDEAFVEPDGLFAAGDDLYKQDLIHSDWYWAQDKTGVQSYKLACTTIGENIQNWVKNAQGLPFGMWRRQTEDETTEPD